MVEGLESFPKKSSLSVCNLMFGRGTVIWSIGEEVKSPDVGGQPISVSG